MLATAAGIAWLVAERGEPSRRAAVRIAPALGPEGAGLIATVRF